MGDGHTPPGSMRPSPIYVENYLWQTHCPVRNPTQCAQLETHLTAINTLQITQPVDLGKIFCGRQTALAQTAISLQQILGFVGPRWAVAGLDEI